jgi:hypothetical protein
MSIGLSLTMIPTAVTQSQWEAFWRNSLHLFDKFPVHLVRVVERDTNYGKIRLLSRNLIDSDARGEFFGFAGDAISLATGEEVRIYRDLEHYRKKWKPADDSVRDPLYCTFSDYGSDDEVINDSGYSPPDLVGVKVFHTSTLGFPYHIAVSSMIMLCEHLLEGQCVGWEQLRIRECMTIRPWICKLFDSDIPLPVCLDTSRLWNRIEGVCGNIKLTTKRFKERFIGTKSQSIHRLLAESRESTMRELAEELLDIDNINRAEAVEISESFLEATDDLDMYLDLIDFRNSLATANNNNPENKNIPLFSLESVLTMLIKHNVTVTKYQCEELYDFKRWMNMDGDAVFSSNTAMIKAFVPRIFEFYCSKSDLLDAFYRRDPENRDKLQEEAEKTFNVTEEQTKRISEVVRMLKNKADNFFEENENNNMIELPDEAVNDPYLFFEYYVKSESHIQARTLTTFDNESVVNIGRKAGLFLSIANKFNFGIDAEELFNDKSGELQKTVIANTINDYAISILERTWNEIENLKDKELLDLLTIVLTMYTKKDHEKIAANIIQLVNQPHYWDLFKKTATQKTKNKK